MNGEKKMVGIGLRDLIVVNDNDLQFSLVQGAVEFIQALHKAVGSNLIFFGAGGKNFCEKVFEWMCSPASILGCYDRAVCSSENEVVKTCSENNVRHFIASSTQSSVIAALRNKGEPLRRPRCYKLKMVDKVLTKSIYEGAIKTIVDDLAKPAKVSRIIDAPADKFLFFEPR